MKKQIKKVFQGVFWQLLAVYAVLVALMALGVFWKYSLQFHLLAIITAFFGIFALPKKESKPKITKRLNCAIFTTAILLIIILRIMPYLNNSIPLGYDAGLYKYGIEHGLKNLDSWILQGGMEPGFLYLMEFFKAIFSTQFILTCLLVFFCALLGFAVYAATKEYFGKQTALAAVFIYALSLIQLKAFEMMYYKNIIGMALMLFALYFLKKSEKREYLPAFIITAGIIGWIHRPSFYIFGLTYLAYTVIELLKNRNLGKNILAGISIIIIALLPYLGRFRQAILIMFDPVLQGFLQPGESPGTFINFFTYQFSILPYLPLAILGLAAFIRKKDINAIVIWALINLAIVYFQFFFFNRFIIFLDIALIIMAASGFNAIIRKKRFWIAAILVLSLAILAVKESATPPLISETALEAIQQLRNTEPNAFAMATSSTYSPWVLGYSERKTIAPGMFDYNKHNKSEWEMFWNTKNASDVMRFLDAYEKPLYIFMGGRQKDTIAQFNRTGCFSIFSEINESRVYKYAC